MLNTKQTNDGIFFTKAKEYFHLAKIFLNVRARLEYIECYFVVSTNFIESWPDMCAKTVY